MPCTFTFRYIGKLNRLVAEQYLEGMRATEQLRNSPSIASVSTNGVNATAHRKDKPAECLEIAAVYAVANLCQSILTIKFLGLGG